jgi:AcrR family transcriptional regulator
MDTRIEPAKAAPVAPLQRPRKKGPGRPEGASVVRDEILDASETIFANRGYAGTTLRQVAEAAKVTQALVSYYFKSKYGLFEAVFMRRGQTISNQRIENLQELTSNGTPGLRAIVRAFLMPTLALRRTPQGRAFLRLQSRLHTEPPEISYRLRTEAYGESTRRYVEAVKSALPGLSELDAHWRVTLMIGTYLYAFSDTHRMEEMAPDVYDPEDSDSLIDQVTRFVVGGFEAR